MSKTKYNLNKESENIIKELRDKISFLEMENTKLRITLDDYGISEDEASEVSDAEAICIKQLSKLRDKSDQGIPFDQEEAKIFEIFNKQLILIRSSESRSKKQPKGKKLSEAELLKLVKSK